MFVYFIFLLFAIAGKSDAFIESSESGYGELDLTSYYKCLRSIKAGPGNADLVSSKTFDYVYNHDVYGWLKLHKLPGTFEEALMKCYYEGAVLASPLNQHLLNALDEIITKSNMNRSIILGTQSVLYGDFFSVEGVRLVDMPINWDMYNDEAYMDKCLILGVNNTVTTTDCSRHFPYVCYKKRSNNTVLNICGTFDNDYMFDKRTGSCYKVYREPKVWNRAHKTCEGDGGYLAIINNAEEAKVIQDFFIIKYGLNSTEKGFVGIRALIDKHNWITVHGEKLEDVYDVWVDVIEDQWRRSLFRHSEPGLFCGYFDPNGLTLRARECNSEAIFVCEKDPKIVRFGPTEY